MVPVLDIEFALACQHASHDLCNASRLFKAGRPFKDQLNRLNPSTRKSDQEKIVRIMGPSKERLGKLYGTLDKIPIPTLSDYSDNFEKRAIVQKQIYLLQELGLDLGYFFKWFAYGPYSEDLSEDIHEVLLRREMNKPLTSSKPLTQSDDQIIEKIDQINQELSENEVFLPEIYEILASLQFIYSRFPGRFKETRDLEDDLITNLCVIKSELVKMILAKKDLLFKNLKEYNLLNYHAL